MAWDATGRHGATVQAASGSEDILRPLRYCGMDCNVTGHVSGNSLYVLTFGSSESECARNLEILCQVCHRLGFPLAEDKKEGPSQKLPFLGIELDCRKLEMWLPADKLWDLRQEVANWHLRKAATKRQLLSLIGWLAHATKVVIPGRIFLRRMIDLAAKAKQLHHWVHLNQEFRSDLLWWKLFLTKWNGTSMLRVHGSGPQDEICSTDASGKWGCVAVW